MYYCIILAKLMPTWNKSWYNALKQEIKCMG